jgi:CRISPR system Cascade subunit CasB
MKGSDKMTEVGKYVYQRLLSLSSQRDSSGGKARFARLRRGAGKTPGELPELWGEFLNSMPESMHGKNGDKNGEPSREEWAVYLSLTMFAIHQQGKSENVHSEGIGIGSAAAMLLEKDTDEERERVLRRFGPVVTAKDMPELAHHLRCLIQLMSSKNIKLDYAMLADDIYTFQFYDRRKNVQLKWGREFYYKKGEDAE